MPIKIWAINSSCWSVAILWSQREVGAQKHHFPSMSDYREEGFPSQRSTFLLTSQSSLEPSAGLSITEEKPSSSDYHAFFTFLEGRERVWLMEEMEGIFPWKVCCVRLDSCCCRGNRHCSEKGPLHQIGFYVCLKEQPGISTEILLHGNCCQQIAGHIITKRVEGLSTECLWQLGMTLYV